VETTIRRIGLGTYHGSAADRGAADSWYRRPRSPHFWPNGTYMGRKVSDRDLTPEERASYLEAYDENERQDLHKEWD
jgi:hypothetical protein